VDFLQKHEQLRKEMLRALSEAKLLKEECREALVELKYLKADYKEVQLIELSDLRDSLQEYKDKLQESDDRLDWLLKQLEAKTQN